MHIAEIMWYRALPSCTKVRFQNFRLDYCEGPVLLTVLERLTWLGFFPQPSLTNTCWSLLNIPCRHWCDAKHFHMYIRYQTARKLQKKKVYEYKKLILNFQALKNGSTELSDAGIHIGACSRPSCSTFEPSPWYCTGEGSGKRPMHLDTWNHTGDPNRALDSWHWPDLAQAIVVIWTGNHYLSYLSFKNK